MVFTLQFQLSSLACRLPSRVRVLGGYQRRSQAALPWQHGGGPQSSPYVYVKCASVLVRSSGSFSSGARQSSSPPPGLKGPVRDPPPYRLRLRDQTGSTKSPHYLCPPAILVSCSLVVSSSSSNSSHHARNPPIVLESLLSRSKASYRARIPLIDSCTEGVHKITFIILNDIKHCTDI